MARGRTQVTNATINGNVATTPLTLTSITGDSTYNINSGTVNVNINGVGFVTGGPFTTCTLNVPGLGSFPVTIVNDTLATASWTAGNSSTVNLYDAHMVCDAQTSNTLTDAITVQCEPSRTIATVVPTNIDQGTTVNVTITGTGFDPLDAIALAESGGGGDSLTVSSVVWVSTTQMTFDVTATATQTVNTYDLTVNNGVCPSITEVAAITVDSVVSCTIAPSGFTVTPNFIPSGTTVNVTLEANNPGEFDDGMTLTLPAGWTQANLIVLDGDTATVDLTAP